ncbi:hypothetical protein [Mucilaginibacter phyllosphaerae]|uniref:Uncharacterized protein n=1 Tax=Mucilaginibacter phyllosphaerae TaxID=1812349 RepID=A0A4Y8AD57_9SPHI|nr:hypothetical protein [Mucilaginibacter phyllosphaerae]MBB3969344.1 hypothetical protein [Mucilaginibacter phyllosphaerae]TEW65866.1 hypothetical protein E2R65_12070 [Mucilaginibacter phyllosphaerae]GGH07834.1 hypothetical protein GCM10007352_12740 [Mucilaginibacter phyllosphaerae]
MSEQNIETQTKMYLYDLNNLAREHGFKADDNWEFSMVTNADRLKIQRNYFPTAATKIGPEILLQVLNQVKARLNQSSSNDNNAADKRTIIEDELDYLVAFNPKRPRS